MKWIAARAKIRKGLFEFGDHGALFAVEENKASAAKSFNAGAHVSSVQ